MCMFPANSTDCSRSLATSCQYHAYDTSIQLDDSTCVSVARAQGALSVHHLACNDGKPLSNTTSAPAALVHPYRCFDLEPALGSAQVHHA